MNNTTTEVTFAGEDQETLQKAAEWLGKLSTEHKIAALLGLTCTALEEESRSGKPGSIVLLGFLASLVRTHVTYYSIPLETMRALLQEAFLQVVLSTVEPANKTPV